MAWLLLALVTNRVLEPSPKLAVATWAIAAVAVPGLVSVAV